MTEDAPGHTTQSEASAARSLAEGADPVAGARPREPREEAVRPVRYLWPTLALLWQTGAR